VTVKPAGAGSEAVAASNAAPNTIVVLVVRIPAVIPAIVVASSHEW